MNFVTKHCLSLACSDLRSCWYDPPMSDIASLMDFLGRGPTVVLSGAGISAASGIPTYRDTAGKWNRSDPIRHQQFLQSEPMRKRYWARSMVGWKQVTNAQPNGAHRSLARLGQLGVIAGIITQNVDGLHDRAGSKDVIDLHGRLDTLVCLNCGDKSPRADLQPRLEALNPKLGSFVAEMRPDGDADIDHYPMESVEIPACTMCAGTLKPDVVFFGDNVPRDRVETAMNSVLAATSLLVVGSSLQVLSGYRFCKAATDANIAVGCINPGVTRADDLFSEKWSTDCSGLLTKACAQY